MISQSFEPSRGRAAKVLVQKLLRAAEAEKQGWKNRVGPHLVYLSKMPLVPTVPLTALIVGARAGLLGNGQNMGPQLA